jgi:hypothetical protein
VGHRWNRRRIWESDEKLAEFLKTWFNIRTACTCHPERSAANNPSFMTMMGA